MTTVPPIQVGKLNDELTRHMDVVLRCTAESKKYRRLLLATPPENRYPYFYPRDTSCAVQTLSRIAISDAGYSSASLAFDLIRDAAHFLKDVQAEDGSWGQRYSLDGEPRGIYIQEDNVAHGIAVIANYLLVAKERSQTVPQQDEFLAAIDRGLAVAFDRYYEKEIGLFRSTTSIHESSIESGYTCWVNHAYHHAGHLATRVGREIDHGHVISRSHLAFREQFVHSVSELFLHGDKILRRFDPEGNPDLRPDITLLSPFYFGFVPHPDVQRRAVEFIEKQLWDPELGMIMRYLPFGRDNSIHVHAGNGPWTQYTAILAQYWYSVGETERGDDLLDRIDQHRNDQGEIPEHLSTVRRFENFMQTEWQTGRDAAKEFDGSILIPGLPFDRILEETNNMARSYADTAKRCAKRDGSAPEGGTIAFAAPLMWSHAEVMRALLVKADDWWPLRGGHEA